jgi:hypothetical protein
LFRAACTLVMLVALGIAVLLLTGTHPLPSRR